MIFPPYQTTCFFILRVAPCTLMFYTVMNDLTSVSLTGPKNHKMTDADKMEIYYGRLIQAELEKHLGTCED